MVARKIKRVPLHDVLMQHLFGQCCVDGAREDGRADHGYTEHGNAVYCSYSYVSR
jgi:hypothetical protein